MSETGGILEQLRQRLANSVQQLDERMHGWLGVLGDAIKETLTPETAKSAAAIAYFTLFSLFPLILLSITITFNVNPLMGWRLVINIFEFIAPALGQLLGDNIANIIRARGPVTGIALLGLIWSGSTVFNTLNQTLNDIWGIKRARPVWARRGLAILLVLALAGPALLLASFASSLIAPLRQWLPEQIPFIRPGVSFTVALLLDMLLLMVLYMLLPHGAASWRELLPGAVGAGLLWELAKKAFLMFVSSYVTASNLVYGSVAAILAFLIWSYASGLIFLFGAYLSCAVYHHKNPAT